MNGTGITHLSFDCYGTLIDWETGILEQALPLLAKYRVGEVNPITVLRSFVKHEAALEGQAFRPYREVLSETFHLIADELGARVDAQSAAEFAAALGQWPPFSDSVDALARLSEHYRLLILSNVDDDLFEHTSRQLKVPFDAVITAQQVRSYKPALAHFEAARERFGLSPSSWVHVAQSLYHDHRPAKQLGLRTIWVDRPSRLTGTGLAPAADVKPDIRCPTLERVADLLGA